MTYTFKKEYRTKITGRDDAVVHYQVVSEDVDEAFPEKGLDKRAYFKFQRVGSDGTVYDYGNFVFAPVEGCCGIVVSAYTFLNKSVRGTGYSDKFRDMKESLARQLGYSMMIATTQMKNIPAVSNMIKSKYNIVDTFTNKRTNNLLGLGMKRL